MSALLTFKSAFVEHRKFCFPSRAQNGEAALCVNLCQNTAIFGDSDEDSGNVDGSDSDIDFEGIDEDAEESDGDNDQTGNEGASDIDEELKEEWWTAELRDIDVNTFMAQSGISIDVGPDPKADNFFIFMFGENLFKKIFMETN